MRALVGTSALHGQLRREVPEPGAKTTAQPRLAGALNGSGPAARSQTGETKPKPATREASRVGGTGNRRGKAEARDARSETPWR